MLPPQFSTPRVDAQGRRFVIHEPSGVRYYVRESDSRGGHVTTYSRSPDARPQQQQRPPRRQQAPQQRPRVADLARATFIEGSEP
jgi:hypothetical protein